MTTITKATYAGSGNTLCIIEPSNRMVSVDDSELQQWVLDGGVVSPFVETEMLAAEAQQLKISALNTAFHINSNTDVVSGGNTYTGGISSALAIKGVADLNEFRLRPNAGIHDTDNVKHEMMVVEMKEVAADIGDAYNDAYETHQAKLKEVDACGDDIACINAVVWP